MNDEGMTPLASTQERPVDTVAVARTLAEEPVTIDCGRCVLRGAACSDCLIGVLVAPPRPVEWDDTELRAIQALVDGGLVPELRLTPMPRASGRKAA